MSQDSVGLKDKYVFVITTVLIWNPTYCYGDIVEKNHHDFRMAKWPPWWYRLMLWFKIKSTEVHVTEVSALLQSSYEALSSLLYIHFYQHHIRPAAVHCNGHLPICPIWTCPWTKNLSNMQQIGFRLCGTHNLWNCWMDLPHLKLHGLV